jgi:signal transduction histidine kinase
MKWGLPAGVDSPLGKRLAWLTALRLLVLATFLVITELYYFKEMVFGGFSTVFAVATAIGAFLASAAYAVLLRFGWRLRGVSHAQLVTDQLIWTAIVYISGGVTSGAASLYGLTCLSGAILLGPPGAVSAGAAGVASYLAMCVGLGRGWVPPPPDQPPVAYLVRASDMVYPAFSTVMVIALVTVLGAYLAERLALLGGRVEEATRRAEQAERLAALGRLAAGLAHEIRNPLGAIRGSVELLREGGELSRDNRRLCEIVEQEAIRLNDLVTDMIDLSRPPAPVLGPLDLAATAQAVVELAGKSLRTQDVAVRYEGPTSLVVKADGAHVHQLLWNLVRNAVQASSAASDVVVRIQAEARGDVLLVVSDHGVGIPASEVAHIFDAFYTTRSHGVGIGLAVVKQIVDAHGFHIEVASEPGVGTRIAVRIPEARREGEPAALATATRASEPGLGSPPEPVET